MTATTSKHKSSGRYIDFVGPIQDRKNSPRTGRPKSSPKHAPIVVQTTSSQPAPARPHKTTAIHRILTSAKPKSTPVPQLSTPVKNVSSAEPSSDASRYVLGGKSPFLENYSINKRPLSDSIPEHSDYHLHRAKNVYNSDIPDTPKSDSDEPVTVIDTPAEKAGLSTAALIIITIVVGIAAGVGAYLLLPK